MCSQREETESVDGCVDTLRVPLTTRSLAFTGAVEMGEETGLPSFVSSSKLPDVCAATPRDMTAPLPPDVPAPRDMPAPPYEAGQCFECAGIYLPPYDMVIPKDTCSLMLKKTPTACSLDTKSNVSDTSMFLPICRICHMSEIESSSMERLISPCRCTGSLQFIHNTCLMVSDIY